MPAKTPEHAGRALAQRHTSRQAQKDATRAQILSSALEVFEEYGFIAGTIEEIARRAGIGRTTFYLYFQTKMDLANAIGLGSFQAFNDKFMQLGAIPPDDLTKLRRWLREYERMLADQRPVSMAATQANVSERSLAKDLLDVYQDFAFTIAVAALPAGQTPSAGQVERLRVLLIGLDRYTYVTTIQEVPAPAALKRAIVEHLSETLKAVRQAHA
jgi:AcrR family transcriptional regulator